MPGTTPPAPGTAVGVARPSPILVHLDDELRGLLPDEQYTKLTRFDGAIAATTSHGDLHRCLHCARWAVEIAEDPRRGALAHLGESIRQLVRELHEAGQGIRFGSIVPGARPVTDVELHWVDGAIRTAQAVAEQSGWDQVPWEALIEDLIAMEPASDQPPGPPTSGTRP